MMKEERQRRILDLLQANNKIGFVELSEQLQVSYDSVRRDVIELEDKGFLKKVHGGAISNSYLNVLHTNPAKVVKGDDLKQILRKTLPLFTERQTILMDGGNTNFFIAEQLPKKLHLTVITNALPLALALNEHSNIETILLGGTYFKHYQITLGIQVMQQVEQLRPDLYFMGVNGVCATNGFTIRHYEEAMLKKQMMQVAKKTVCCVISEKLGVVESYQVSAVGQVDTMITNLRPDDPQLNAFAQQGLQLL